MEMEQSLALAGKMLSALPADLSHADTVRTAAFALGGAIAFARQENAFVMGTGSELMRSLVDLVEEVACSGKVTVR
ncbi:hypothetical protein [uncultured Sphingomonas sp.]|uniref:hypothetical protein n=1 Tax=uncultured Sphingomonas sp. TaxID=158754 RepID=UPI00374A0612